MNSINKNIGKTALLAGATGLVGGLCLNYLLNEDSYSKVKIFLRRKLNISNPKLEKYIINFDKLEEQSNLVEADDIFCCLGTTIKKAGTQENFKKVDFEYPLKFAKTGLENGAKHFSLVSSLGADKYSKIFYNRVKGELEEELKKINYQSINIYRPSLLLGKRNEFRLGEKFGMVVMKLLGFTLQGKLKKYRAINADTVASVMVKNAQKDLKGINIFESDKIQKLSEIK